MHPTSREPRAEPGDDESLDDVDDPSSGFVVFSLGASFDDAALEVR